MSKTYKTTNACKARRQHDAIIPPGSTYDVYSAAKRGPNAKQVKELERQIQISGERHGNHRNMWASLKVTERRHERRRLNRNIDLD